MPTGIHTRSPRCQAVVVRDNAAWGNQYKPEWRYEVCFAKQLGIGRNGVAEHPFSSVGGGERERNHARMVEWCERTGVEVYTIFPSGVGFSNEHDQMLCYLTWR